MTHNFVFIADELFKKNHEEYNIFHSYELIKEDWSKAILFAHQLGLDVWDDLSCDFAREVIELNKEFIKGVKLYSPSVSIIYL